LSWYEKKYVLCKNNIYQFYNHWRNTASLQCKTLTGITTYELGIVTEFGTNEGVVDGTTDQTLIGADVWAGTVIVPHVLMTSFEEIIYYVSVWITTVTVETATLGGITEEMAG